MQLHYLGLHEVSEQIRTQRVSPVAVVEACLARVGALNPSLNAFITVLADEARGAAKQAEQEIKDGKWRGPLHGVPVAFKDMYDTAGVRTTAAFELFKNRTPHKDAVAVAKLKEAGAIVIGKTNMHTLAMGTTSAVSAFGPVHNAWNPAYIAGGSSGGSAVAVATGMCYATVDTDAVGSTRLPAACCGVVGYKCTWGRIDNTGILDGEQADPMILKLSTAGIMARDTTGIALVADVLAGTNYTEALESDAPHRLGIVATFSGDTAIRAAVEAARVTYEGLGFTCVTTTAPMVEQPDMQHMDERRKTVNRRRFADIDALILPTLAAEVPTLAAVGEEAQALSPQHTFFANYEGLPAVTVPCGFDENGLPMGLQIVAKQGDDAVVLQLAQAYLRAVPGQIKHPK